MTVHALKTGRFERIAEDALHSRVLAPTYYTDPRAFEIEKREVFYKSWIYVGHVSQIARVGDHMPARVADQPVLLLRDRAGAVRAFYNVCVHRGMTLVDRPGCANTLKCPYHGWIYDLSGRLVAARNTAQMGEAFTTADHGLREIRAEVRHGLIFVNLDAEAAPLDATIGPLLADIAGLGLDPAKLKHAKTVDYDIHTNWKIAVDNYVECYHCPIAHPGIERYFEYEKTFARVEDWGVFAGGPAYPETLEGYKAECAANGWPLVSESRYNWAWPNMMFLLGWAARPHLLFWTIEPVAHDRIIFRHNYFFYDDELSQEHRDFVVAIDKVQREDNPILEGVWDGMNSMGFASQGTYVINDGDTYQTERGVHQFHLQLQRIYDRAGFAPG